MITLPSFCLECLSADSLRFFAVGDFGGSPEFPYYTKVETGVAKTMGSIGDKYQTSFTLALGDNFYDDGVKNVKDRRFEVLFCLICNMDDSFILPFILKILQYSLENIKVKP